VLNLEDYARQMVKSAGAKKRLGEGVRRGAAKLRGIVSSGTKAFKDAVIRAGKDAGAEKEIGELGGAASAIGKVISRPVTIKGADGKRRFSAMKSMIVGAPIAGAHYGSKKNKMKTRPIRHYGPMKPLSVYVDPRRRLQ